MSELYPANAAGFLAHTDVPFCGPDDTVGSVLAFLREFAQTYHSINYIYVLEQRTLVGVLSIHELFSSDQSRRIADIMTTNVAYAHAHTDQEQLAEIALAQGVKAIPVIDDNREFIGAVSSDTILRILNEEHLDDLYKSAGLDLSATERQEALSWTRKVTSRLPWLVLGLGGGVLAAFIIERFEGVIATHIALAAFIPAIVYVGDAVGNQSEMLFIRWLTRRSSMSAFAYLCRELSIATVIGFFLGLLMAAVSYVWLHDIAVTAVLGITVWATVLLSTTITIVLPWLFQKLGHDPAVASGPLATVLCDISSLALYLLIALYIL